MARRLAAESVVKNGLPVPAAKGKRLAVDWVPIDSVVGNPSNPRKNEDAVDHVAGSLSRFGWQQPIVVRRKGKVVLAGNTRLKAARSLGMKEVPVVWWTGSDIEATAYGIADNRSSEFAAWDSEALVAQLRELENAQALDGVGFTSEDLDRMMESLAGEELREEGQGGQGVEKAAAGFEEDVRAELETLAGYRTAIARTKLSAPMRWYRQAGLLKGEVLDYGCGLDPHDFARFDPEHFPNYDLLGQAWDVVTCNFVLNVLPLEHNRHELLLALAGLIAQDGIGLVAVWQKAREDTATEAGYQCGWSRDAWDELLGRYFEAERLKASTFWGWELRHLELE